MVNFVIHLAINISFYKKRNARFNALFGHDQGLWYCTNVTELFQLIKYPYDPNQWRLFIDSSLSGLKVVLLHNKNIQPSLPLAYSKKLKETRESMALILDKLNYPQHKWRLCCDLKVVGFLMGLKKGNTTYPCFLCEWDHGKRNLHYTNTKWNRRPVNPTVGEKSIEHERLVDPEAIIFPALHITLQLKHH